MKPELELEIRNATELCVKAHAGQFRRDGVTPYHTHPFAVAEKVPDELKPAALLHDVIEDTTTTLAELFKIGSFSNRTLNAVWMVTRSSDITYDNYMEVLMKSNDAIIIKIADMEHNLSCDPSENSKRKIAKWLPKLKEVVRE
jgi:(p)ppGpp synthase/HD superfamily hydrolase